MASFREKPLLIDPKKTEIVFLQFVLYEFVLYELPHYATQKIFQQVLLILRPGGLMAIIDIDPASATVQNMSSHTTWQF